MRALLEIETENPQLIKDSIEIDEREYSRMKISSKVEGKKLIVEIDAEDFSSLRAGVSSYLRLIKACLEVP